MDLADAFRKIYSHRWALFIFLALMLYHYLTLMKSPAPWADEGWTGSRALGLIQHGIPFGILDGGYVIDIKRYWAPIPLLPYLFYSIAPFFSGTVELLQLRMVNLVFGGVLLATMYWLGCALLNRSFGRWCMICTSLSPFFLEASHPARPDIMGITFGYLSLAIYFSNKNQKNWPNYIAGLLLGLALELQLRTSILWIPMGLFMLLDLGRSFFKRASFWAYFFGFACGLLFWLYYHILLDPASYFKSFAAIIGSSRTPPVATMQVSDIIYSIFSVFYVFWYFCPITCVFAACAIVLVMAMKDRAHLRVGLLAVSTIFCGALVIRDLQSFNAIAISPSLDILAALGMELFWIVLGSRPSLINRLTRITLSILLVLGSFERISSLVSNSSDCYPAYLKSQEFINSLAGGRSFVVGPQIYWMGLQNSKYYTWEGLIFYRRFRGITLAQTFDHFSPDIFILDDQIRNFMSDEVNFSPWREDLRVPSTELLEYLKRRGEVIGTHQTRCVGKIEVYKIKPVKS